MAYPLPASDPEPLAVGQQQLLAYEALSRCSARMLEAARQADWETLIELQSEYLGQVEALQQSDDADAALDQGEREHKAKLLRVLLDQDREIRERLVARREQLSQMIVGSRQQQNLSRTYSYYQGTSEVIEAAQRFSPF